jgi:hypothetical protein
VRARCCGLHCARCPSSFLGEPWARACAYLRRVTLRALSACVCASSVRVSRAVPARAGVRAAAPDCAVPAGPAVRVSVRREHHRARAPPVVIARQPLRQRQATRWWWRRAQTLCASQGRQGVWRLPADVTANGRGRRPRRAPGESLYNSVRMCASVCVRARAHVRVCARAHVRVCACAHVLSLWCRAVAASVVTPHQHLAHFRTPPTRLGLSGVPLHTTTPVATVALVLAPLPSSFSTACRHHHTVTVTVVVACIAPGAAEDVGV